MRGNITVPKGIISGAFNIRVSLPKPVQWFSISNILIETVSGQPLGHQSDRFGGNGKDYHLLCYPPEASIGETRFSLQGNVTVPPENTLETLEAVPRTVTYDTVRIVTVTFGAVVRTPKQIRLPIQLSTPVIGLTKKHFSFEQVSGTNLEGTKIYLYGSDDAYELVFVPKIIDSSVFTVSTSSKQVRKLTDAWVGLAPASVEV